MRKFLIYFMAVALITMSACGTPAQSADSEAADIDAETSATARDEAVPPEDSIGLEETANGRGFGERNRNIRMGRIVSVSESEITVELAAIQRPEREAPEENGQPAERKRPEGLPQPNGDRSNIDDRSNPEREAQRGGRGAGGQMDLTYSGDQETYSITENVKITKGMDGNSAAISVTDLVKDNVVRLSLDENGALVSILLWSAQTDAVGEAS